MPLFLNHADFNGNEARTLVLENRASDPGSPKVGQAWFNTSAGADTQGRLKIKLGTRTITLDDQYVSGVVAGGTPNGISIGGTALAPTVSMLLASGSQIGAMSTSHYSLVNGATNAATGSTLAARDSSGNANFNMIQVAADPVNGNDVVRKSYFDNTVAGFDPKGSAVLATGNALPSCVYSNGTAGVGATLTASVNSALTSTLIDGTSAHTLAVNDAVLVKNEATSANNGIYIVSVVGNGSTKWVLTRAINFNTATQGIPGAISNGAFVSIEQGASAGTLWMLGGLTDAGLTVGSTSLAFSSFGAGQVYTAGNGLSLAANQFTVNLTGTSTLEFNGTSLRVKGSSTSGQVLRSGGSGVEPSYGALDLANASAVTGTLPVGNGGTGVTTGAANLHFATPSGSAGAPSLRALTALDIPVLDFAKISTGIVPVLQGGTGSSTAAGSRTNLGATGKSAGLIGDGSATSIDYVHNLGTLDVAVALRDAATGNGVYTDWKPKDTNTVTLTFTLAPAASAYRVTVEG